jgi:hypothetical protein
LLLELRPHQQLDVHEAGVEQVLARQQALGRQRRVDLCRLLHVGGHGRGAPHS